MEAEFITLMPHSITVKPWSSQDKYGKPTFGTAKTYTGRVVNKVKKVLDINGEERVSNTIVYLNTTDRIDVRDEMTLPAGFVPQVPRIIRVDRFPDENGLHHTVIFA